MADRVLRAVITGSSAGAVKAFQETSLAADATGTKIGDKFDKVGGKVSGAFGKMAQSASGIPIIGASLEKMSGGAAQTFS